MPAFIQQTSADNIELMYALLDCFSETFEEPENYSDKQPDKHYLTSLLSTDYFIALAATDRGKVIGGLAAYELKKFEQMRSEIYTNSSMI